MSGSANDNDMIGTTDAAKLLSMSRANVVRLCERGRIDGAEQVSGNGGHWRIPRASVLALKESSRPKKRQPQRVA